MNNFNTADLCDDHKLAIAQPIFKSMVLIHIVTEE